MIIMVTLVFLWSYFYMCLFVRDIFGLVAPKRKSVLWCSADWFCQYLVDGDMEDTGNN